jgi:hypothetical protein
MSCGAWLRGMKFGSTPPSIIGPFWLTPSMSIMIAGLGVVYAKLWQTPVQAYLPHLAIGLVFWSLISAILLDGCQIFISKAGLIRQLHAPLSLYAYQMLFRNLIIFAHHLLIIVVVLPLCGVSPGWQAMLALPGLLLLAINGLWASLALGMLCARYRDVPQIMLSLADPGSDACHLTAERLTDYGLVLQPIPCTTCWSWCARPARAARRWRADRGERLGCRQPIDGAVLGRHRGRTPLGLNDECTHPSCGRRRNFPIFDGRTRSLKQQLIASTIGGHIGRRKPASQHTCADGIDLELGHGARAGLVGQWSGQPTCCACSPASTSRMKDWSACAQGGPAVRHRSWHDMQGTGHENIVLRGLYLGFDAPRNSGAQRRNRRVLGAGQLSRHAAVYLLAGMHARHLRSRLIDAEILLLDEGIAPAMRHSRQSARAHRGWLGAPASSSLPRIASRYCASYAPTGPAGARPHPRPWQRERDRASDARQGPSAAMSPLGRHLRLALTNPAWLLRALRTLQHLLREQGLLGLLARLDPQHFAAPLYRRWLRRCPLPPAPQAIPCRIALLLATEGAPAGALAASIASVLQQRHTDWELWIAHPAGSLPPGLATDARIRFIDTPVSRSGQWNRLLQETTAEVALALRAGQLLHAELPAWLGVLFADGGLKAVRWDSDQLDARGRRTTPRCLPAWDTLACA